MTTHDDRPAPVEQTHSPAVTSADLVEQTHGPSVTWDAGGTVGYVCACGGSWPCEEFRLADDARRHRDRVARDIRQAAG